MRPSAPIAKNASTLFGSRLRVGAPCAAALSSSAPALPDMANATVSAPPLSSVRREGFEKLKEAFMSASLRCSAEHRADDAIMRTAAAEVAVEFVADLRFGWPGRSREQRG